MNVLDNISSEFSIDVKQPPSEREEIEKLKAISKINIPQEYIDLLTIASDVEINVVNQLYIRLWGAAGCIEMNDLYEVQRYIPESLAIGDDEGGGALIYMNGNEGFGVYYNRFADLDRDEAVMLAPSLTDLLVKGVGINTLLNV